jgi:amino acid transporter
MLSVVVLGAYYLFVSYAEVIGFGVNPEGVKCLTKDTAAFDTLAATYGGLWLRLLIDIAAMTSLFALHVATINSITRIIFAMGRENLLPKFLGKASTHYHTPQASILTLWGFTVLVTLVAGHAWGPANAFGYLAFLATLALIPLYMLVNLSVPIVYSRYFRTEFGIFRHLVVPVVGILGLIWVLKGNVYPVPDVPFNIFIYLIVAYIIAGLVVVQWLGRTRADLMAQAGMILAGVEGEQSMPSSSTN